MSNKAIIEIADSKKYDNSQIFEGKLNGLFSLKQFGAPESFDIIRINRLNETKFSKLIIKECWYYLKVGGFLEIDFFDKNILNCQGLTSILALLLKNDYEFHTINNNEDSKLFMVRKGKSSFVQDDNINKWTFGIVTNGKRLNFLQQAIDSIHKQHIDSYEIIICGNLPSNHQLKFNKYIHFTDKDEIGWITRKKNLIVEYASHENLMIMHDKIVLDENWYEGMKRYGNCFESLSCVTTTPDGIRYGDWKIVTGREMKFIKNRNYSMIKKNVNLGKAKESLLFNQYYLTYEDWDEDISISGHFNIVKKSIASRVRWDENLYWYCAEDVMFSYDLNSRGFLHRFNPFSKVFALSFRQLEKPIISFSDKRRGKIKGQVFLRIAFTIVKLTMKLGLDSPAFYRTIERIKKHKIYKWLLR